MSEPPCIYCRGPVQPEGTPCPSCKGVTLHGCKPDTYDHHVQNALDSLTMDSRRDFIDPDLVIPDVVQKLRAALKEEEPGKARDLILDARAIPGTAAGFIDLHGRWFDASKAMLRAYSRLTCGAEDCDAPIEPICSEPDRCLMHGTTTFDKLSLERMNRIARDLKLESKLAAFVRAVGRGDPLVGGECHCGGLFLAYTAGQGGESVAHTKPTCDDFTQCEPDEYLHRVRMKKIN